MHRKYFLKILKFVKFIKCSLKRIFWNIIDLYWHSNTFKYTLNRQGAFIEWGLSAWGLVTWGFLTWGLLTAGPFSAGPLYITPLVGTKLMKIGGFKKCKIHSYSIKGFRITACQRCISHLWKPPIFIYLNTAGQLSHCYVLNIWKSFLNDPMFTS